MQDFTEDPRIYAAGFYDRRGIWFYTWERDFPGEWYSYGLADALDHSTKVLLYDEGEISLNEYIKFGLPPQNNSLSME